MVSPIHAISTIIRETPYDSDSFKGIVLIPIVGHVVQAWKRHQLVADIEAVGLNSIRFSELPSDLIKTTDGRNAFNEYAVRTSKLINFDVVCFNYSRFSDVALILGGLALSIIAPPVGIAIAGFGFASLFARKLILILNEQYRDQLEAQRPQNLPAGAPAYMHLS